MSYIQSSLFLVQLVLQVSMILLFFVTDVSFQIQAYLAGLLLCTVGIPHGANDHLYDADKSVMGKVTFVVKYLGVMLLYAGLWWIAPILALLLFFAISFHHFGQSNFQNPSIWYVPSLLWGIWILAFPVLLHFEEATSIFSAMLRFNATNTVAEPLGPPIHTWQLILAIGFAMVYASSLFFFERKHFFRYLAQFAGVSLWYTLTPLLFGFVVVFCLWHSIQSLQHQSVYFRGHCKGTFRQFVLALVPFSIVALGTVGLYVYFQGFAINDAFILLSLITLPHIVIMHKLYARL